MASDPDLTSLPAAATRTQFYCLERPEPSSRYLELARAAPCRLELPKKLLIVLDLNGTLLVAVSAATQEQQLGLMSETSSRIVSSTTVSQYGRRGAAKMLKGC